jgi:mitotic spindle assembly checkpoint protein MAD1
MDSRRPFAPPSNVLLPVQRQPPLTSTVPFSSSTLGKRGAADAGLETAAGGHRRALSSATAIQAKLLAAERREAEALERVEEQRVEIERLKSERRMLYEGETFERTTAETREKEWAEERVSLS